MEVASLQEYLDIHLENAEEATPELIAKLKKEWRLTYITRYHRRYRDDFVQVGFWLPKTQYTTLIKKAGDIKPRTFCKRLIQQEIFEAGTSDLLPIKVKVLELNDMIEEAQFEQRKLTPEELLPIIQTMLDVFN